MQLVRNDTQTNSWATVQHIDFDGGSFDEGSVQLVYTNATTGAKVFASSTDIANATGKFTKTAHGLVTGAVGQFTTSSALPTGLSTSTNYFVIVVDANTIKFATTLANAAAGTALTISDNGTGNQTFTPTTLATTGAVAKLQVSNDGTTFTDVTSASVTITAAGNTYWEFCTQATGRSLRVKTVRVLFTPTTGTVALSVTPCLYKANN